MRMKVCALALLLAVLMSGIALAQETARLPIDFSPGMKPNPEGYIGEFEYEDPTIHVKIEKGRVDECTYWVARIKIADASQLRTMSAGGFNKKRTTSGTNMAKRTKAVLAIDGDYFWYTGEGYIVRQGEKYLNKLKGKRDVLIIDEDGDFHVFFEPEKDAFDGTVDGKKIINAFYFGPILVNEGKSVKQTTKLKDVDRDIKRQRMCIAQTGPLSYMAVCCAAPARGSAGMTLQQFADLVAGLGDVQIAYNLDGGDSTMMIFKGEKINDVNNWRTRAIADIVYFASAWQEEEEP